MFTANKVDAARCERIRQVNRVVPDAKLQDEAFALAKSMAEGPTIALPLHEEQYERSPAVRFLHRSTTTASERLVRTTMTTDHKEAVQAFIEKRKAVLQGKLASVSTAPICKRAFLKELVITETINYSLLN